MSIETIMRKDAATLTEDEKEQLREAIIRYLNPPPATDREQEQLEEVVCSALTNWPAHTWTPEQREVVRRALARQLRAAGY